jgi:hypothetical protein
MAEFYIDAVGGDQATKKASNVQFANIASTGTITVDTINEKTADNGIVLESVTLKDGDINLTAAAHSIGASIGANTLTLGGATSTVYIPGNMTIDGDTIAGDVVQHIDKNIEVGKDGTTAALTGAGLSFLGDSNAVVGYFQVGASDNSLIEIKAPGNEEVLTVDINATKTITVAGALNIESDSAINQDATTDSTTFAVAGITLTGDVTLTGQATDIDLVDNNASALSFDAAGKAGILEIVTTNDAEKVAMSGGLDVAGEATLANVTMDNGGAVRTTTTTANTVKLQAYDVDGTAYTDFITLTSGDTPTCVISGDATGTTQSANDNSTKLATTAYADAASFTVVNVTGTTQEISGTADIIYLANNVSLVTFTYAATVAQGIRTKVIGVGAGGWKVAQLADPLQQTHTPSGSTTAGAAGYVSGAQHNGIDIICTAENTTFFGNPIGAAVAN